MKGSDVQGSCLENSGSKGEKTTAFALTVVCPRSPVSRVSDQPGQ